MRLLEIQKKIKMACAYKEISLAELARAIDYTPQAFNQRMRTGKFSDDELHRIAKALNATYTSCFTFADGTKFE
ncbi:MAG: helix-turn-helix transcriptional regulator [Lachnospiraceae bacterium]|nr:helix-turn-helix transcriptional regulator [Lachnospiraceae bacterium]